ncbi:DUF1007 family protein [Bradyrhizobium sp. TZ2]
MPSLLLLLGAALTLAAAAARAHPLVRITATSELLYVDDGSITGVRHAWAFDDMFSAYAVQGLKGKTKGAYTSKELGSLAQTNVKSLKEYAYFTSARADGKKKRFQEPVDYFLDYKDTVLTLHFTLPLKNPVKSKQLVLEVFDRSFFIDFQMAKDNPVKLVGAPAGCQMKLERPSDGSASAQKLNEQTFVTGSNFGILFANKITVDCP